VSSAIGVPRFEVTCCDYRKHFRFDRELGSSILTDNSARAAPGRSRALKLRLPDVDRYLDSQGIFDAVAGRLLDGTTKRRVEISARRVCLIRCSGVAHGLALASWASRLLGLNEQAVALGNLSLGLRRADGDGYGEAESLALLAAAGSASGDEATSLTLLQQSRGIRQAIGDRAGVAECDAELARIAASA